MVYQYDAFISHAFADKNDVAIPLQYLLEARSCTIWMDKTSLTIGDTLKRKIDDGLQKARYAIVIISPHFFARQWPQYELDGLLAREMVDAVKVILPVWHKVKQVQVMQYSAPLSMRVGGHTNDMQALADELAEIIRNSRCAVTTEIQDEISLAKHAILSGALPTNTFRVLDEEGQVGQYVVIGHYGFNDTEKQRKLFLYAMKELEKAGLVEHTGGMLYELTYEGIQVAERMEPLKSPERLGTKQLHL